MLKTFVFKEGNILTDLSFEQIAQCVQDSSAKVWLDIQELIEEEADFLVKTFRFHPLAIEDCMGDYIRPKREDYDDHMFIIFDSLTYDRENEEYVPINLNCFLSKNYIVTIAPRKIREVDVVCRNTKALPKIFLNGSDYILYSIMDRIVDNYFVFIRDVSFKIDGIEDRIAADDIEEIQEDILVARKDILTLRRHIAPQRDILTYFKLVDNPYINKKNKAYFRDILDHASRVIDALNQNREILNWAMDSYRSEISSRANDTMKVLSIVATMMLPLTLVTGIYGMNFHVLPGSENPLGFWSVMLFMLLLSGGMIYYFKKKKWI